MDVEELIRQVIGAAIQVHRVLGPGFVESVYETALAVELKERGIPFERQKTVPVRYWDQQVGEHRLDLVVAGCLVVENKAVRGLDDIGFAVVRSYLESHRPAARPGVQLWLDAVDDQTGWPGRNRAVPFDTALPAFLNF